MPRTADAVHDVAVHHRISLSRYSTSVVRKVMALLNRTEATIVARLQRADNESVSGARLDQLLTELRTIQREGWTLINNRMQTEVGLLTAAEVEFSARLAGVTVDPVFGVMFSPVPPIEQIVAAVNARPFQGRLLREWLAGAEENAAGRIRDTVRQGFVEGLPTANIVRAIRGTRVNNYRDGIVETTRRGAEAMVRTALTHTANTAAQAAWEANADVVTAWRFVATLDARTTLVCAGLHGKVFPVGGGKQPPRHINCRSTSMPVVGDIEGVETYVPKSYQAWLKSQPAEVQNDILGVKKARLFRDGGLNIDRFTDNKGKTLTLDELRQRDLEAFRRAGLE